MSIGESGRIVVELSPHTKRELYAALSRDGLTLKAWLIIRAEEYLLNQKQASLFEKEDCGNDVRVANEIKGISNE